MNPAKVSAITEWPKPKSVHDIRVFLGLANFYRQFIKDFSKIASPITSLLKKSRKFHWDASEQVAFEQLKGAFTSAPILRHFDPTLSTVLEVDASDFALGAVISQRDPIDGLLHPITFHSRKFQSAEQNYKIYDKEMRAIVETMDHYRHYFEGLGQQVKCTPITATCSGSQKLKSIIVAKCDGQRSCRGSILSSSSDLASKGGNQTPYPVDLITLAETTMTDAK